MYDAYGIPAVGNGDRLKGGKGKTKNSMYSVAGWFGVGDTIEKERDLYNMHDYIITFYNVDLKNKTIETCAEDMAKEHTSRFFT